MPKISRLDLNLKENCETAARGAHEIYNLAANMGGMGFIEHNKALCMLSVLINTHMLQAAVKHGVKRFFYSSSACVYNGDKQTVSKRHHSRKKTLTRPSPKTATAGKNSFPNECAGTSAKTSAWKPV